MATDWLLLGTVAFIASTIQAATGFGFALLAVPAFLVILGSVAAIQSVIVVCLVTSIVIWPTLRGRAPRRLLATLAAGSLAGLPLGIGVYLYADLTVIKTGAAVTILAVAGQAMWRLAREGEPGGEARGRKSGGTAMDLAVGAVSGALATGLAMPGPPLMLYLSRSRLDKDEIRATILTYFVFAYGAALAVQAAVAGIDPQTWRTAAAITPAAVAGVIAGHHLAKRIGPRVFRATVLILLVATGGAMLVEVAVQP